MTNRFAGSPTVRRRRLGALLKANRDHVELSPEDVAVQLSTTPRTVLRWESGQSLIRLQDLRLLIEMYRVVSEDERIELETLQREGSQRGWWTPYTSGVRPTYRTLMGLEAEATSSLEYTAIVIPGLLQTRAYMEAIMIARTPMLTDAEVKARVDLRLERQNQMAMRDDIKRHFVIDESCFHRNVGGPATMTDQIKHIIDLAESTRLITVQVLQLTIGAHASTMGSFSVLTFDHPDPPVAFVEGLTGDLYGEGPDALVYLENFNSLREAALPEPSSLARADTIMREVHHAP